MSLKKEKGNKEKKVTLKQLVAAVGIILLLGMYVVSLLLGILARPGAEGMFLASLACTIIIPVGVYGLLRLAELRKKNEEKGMTLGELRRYNRRLKNGESAEELAKEIEEKYGEKKE